MIKSLPIVPAAPNQRLYSVDVLHLFKTYNRRTYFEEFGENAPAWNPASGRIKRWFDSSFDDDFDKDTIVTYRAYVLGKDGYPEFSSIQLTKGSAGTINLPGFDLLPAYQVRPTAAVFREGDLSTPVDPYMLSTLDEAMLMAKEFRLPKEQIFQDTGMVAWPLSEERRLYELKLEGRFLPVGYLLKEKYKNGVGGEGHWEDLTWVSTHPVDIPSIDSRPEIPVPCRPLNSDEEFTNNMLDRFEIKRTSISDEPFNSEDRKRLNALWETVIASK